MRESLDNNRGSLTIKNEEEKNNTNVVNTMTVI